MQVYMRSPAHEMLMEEMAEATTLPMNGFASEAGVYSRAYEVQHPRSPANDSAAMVVASISGMIRNMVENMNPGITTFIDSNGLLKSRRALN